MPHEGARAPAPRPACTQAAIGASASGSTAPIDPAAAAPQVVDENASARGQAKRVRAQPALALASQVSRRAALPPARPSPALQRGARAHPPCCPCRRQDAHALHKLSANLDAAPAEDDTSLKAPQQRACEPEAQQQQQQQQQQSQQQLPGAEQHAAGPGKHLQRPPASLSSPYLDVNLLLKELHYQRILRHGLEPLQPEQQ
jgi:hypothetical protein